MSHPTNNWRWRPSEHRFHAEIVKDSTTRNTKRTDT